MNMKKIMIVVALVTGLGFAAFQQASARGGGWGNGYGGDCPYDCNQNYQNQQLDDATKAKVEAFRTETMELRKQMAMKRAEKMALMNGQAPDPQAVSKVEGELFDLRMEMQNKAKEAGVPVMGMGFQGMRGGPGNGGQGRGMGRGMGPCFNQQGWN